MFKIICVTNRKIAKDSFINQIESICKAGIDTVILREKDLDNSEYKRIAINIKTICEKYNVEFIVNSFFDVAIELGIGKVHLPFKTFMELPDDKKNQFDVIGVSCHSAKEAKMAENNGASYIIAGHVFATDCKKDLEPRGINFIEDVCSEVSIPVYGIGGINKENVALLKNANASGCCIMSGLMKCDNVDTYIEEIRNAI